MVTDNLLPIRRVYKVIKDGEGFGIVFTDTNGYVYDIAPDVDYPSKEETIKYCKQLQEREDAIIKRHDLKGDTDENVLWYRLCAYNA